MEYFTIRCPFPNLKLTLMEFLCVIKRTTMAATKENSDQLTSQILMYLELGNISGEQGNEEQAIDYYIKGLQLARETQDRPRIQQLSNLILTYI